MRSMATWCASRSIVRERPRLAGLAVPHATGCDAVGLDARRRRRPDDGRGRPGGPGAATGAWTCSRPAGRRPSCSCTRASCTCRRCRPRGRRGWALGPRRVPDEGAAALVGLLASIVGQFLHAQREVEHAAFELAERYEEINLLYTTSEIFGRTVTLEEAAARILEEIADTVGAQRGDAARARPRDRHPRRWSPRIGFSPTERRRSPRRTTRSISARVFRAQRPVIAGAGAGGAGSRVPPARARCCRCRSCGPTPAHAPQPLGVLNLSDRRSREPFSAGDEKLVAAIAHPDRHRHPDQPAGAGIDQPAAAPAGDAARARPADEAPAEDARTSLPEAQVAARVVPAESVGGDFYHLFRLGEGTDRRS